MDPLHLQQLLAQRDRLNRTIRSDVEPFIQAIRMGRGWSKRMDEVFHRVDQTLEGFRFRWAYSTDDHDFMPSAELTNEQIQSHDPLAVFLDVRLQHMYFCHNCRTRSPSDACSDCGVIIEDELFGPDDRGVWLRTLATWGWEQDDEALSYDFLHSLTAEQRADLDPDMLTRLLEDPEREVREAAQLALAPALRRVQHEREAERAKPSSPPKTRRTR